MIQILVIVQSTCPGSNWITNLVAYIARANHGFYSNLKSNWRHCYPPPLFPTPLFLTPPPLSGWDAILSYVNPKGFHQVSLKGPRLNRNTLYTRSYS